MHGIKSDGSNANNEHVGVVSLIDIARLLSMIRFQLSNINEQYSIVCKHF